MVVGRVTVDVGGALWRLLQISRLEMTAVWQGTIIAEGTGDRWIDSNDI